MEGRSSGNSRLDRFLRGFESAANLLPTPFTIFGALFIITAIISIFVSGTTEISPATGEQVLIQNFISKDGFHWLIENLITNYTSYAPLGVVLVMTIAIGLCEQTGLLTQLIERAMKAMPRNALPYFTIMIGIIGQVASDSAQVLIPPLAGAMYLAAGRHPVVGVLTAFSGVGLGYLANPLVTTTDVLTMGITNSVLEGFMPEIQVDAISSHYFKIVSFLFLAVVMGFISDKIVEPRWGKYTGKALDEENTEVEQTNDPAVRKGFKYAAIATIIYIALLVIGGVTVPGLLLNEDGSLGGSPLLKGVVPLIFFLLSIAGIAYGIGSGSIKSESDVGGIVSDSLGGMGSYLAMAFTAAQFTALFNWTNMGTVLSIKGARLLENSGFDGPVLFVVFILFVVLIDFLITSSSAKWTVLAPIFVPMFSYLGYHPAFIQTAYRIGDAGANIIGPLNVFLWMLLDICQERYDESLQIGDFLSTLLIFFVVSQIGFIIIFLIFMAFQIPVGPGSPVYL